MNGSDQAASMNASLDAPPGERRSVLPGSESSEGRATAADTPWPSAQRGWWAVGVFILTLTAANLDRGVLNLLVESIKRDLHLSDTQMSLLIGFAFVAFYLLVGLPIARWVDRGSRRLILGFSVATWSIGTSLCGIAHNFTQLALCRLGMGAADAATAPGIGSMIADFFPRERLARAMSVMAVALVGGNALALLLGAAVIHGVAHVTSIQIPLVGRVFPWQLTFFIVGVPSLLVAALYMTLPEPVRRGRLGREPRRGTIAIRDVIRFLIANRAAYGPMFWGFALGIVVSAGYQAWTPTLFSRNYGWSAAHFGSVAGSIVLVLAPLGLLAGIRGNEWLYSRGYKDANMRLTVIVHWLVLPATILLPLMPTARWALALYAWATVVTMGSVGSLTAALTTITPNEMRGQVTALYMIVYNVIGFGIGPTLIAFCTDHVFGHESQLRYAMFVVALLLAPAGNLILTLGVPAYGRAYVRSEQWR